MEKFICNTCGYVYDPAVGDPDAGIAPGTPFESLPDDWVCPLCGVGKDDFEHYNEEAKQQQSASRPAALLSLLTNAVPQFVGGIVWFPSKRDCNETISLR